MNARTGTAAALGALLALLPIGSAIAEVSLHPAGARLGVRIQTTPRGVWSPVGNERSPLVLNPAGDVMGDGFPSHARARDGVLVAWHRPATSELLVAEGDAHGWNLVGSWTTGLPVGAPRILATGSGAFVAWTELDGDGYDLRLVRVDTGVLIVEEGERWIDGATSGEMLAWIADEGGLDGSGQLVLSVLTPPHRPVDLERYPLGPTPQERWLRPSAVRAFDGAEIGEAGRIVLAIPADDEGRLRVLSIETDGNLQEEGEIREPMGHGEGALRAALRRHLSSR